MIHASQLGFSVFYMIFARWVSLNNLEEEQGNAIHYTVKAFN